MTRFADKVVAVVGLLGAFVLVLLASWQHGYDTAKAECKPVRKEIPFKDMTYKQQVKWTKWLMRDPGVVK